MSFLTDFFSDYYRNQYDSPSNAGTRPDMNGNPFPSPPQQLYDNLGRSTIYNMTHSLMTNPTLMGGLAGGLQGADQIYGQGISQYRQQQVDAQKQQIDLKAKLLDIRGKQQDQELARAKELRDEEKFKTDQTQGKEKFKWEGEDHGAAMDKSTREAVKFDQDMEDKDKIEAAANNAVSLAKTPQQKALFKLMADSGQYDQLWKVVTAQTIPDPNRPSWGEPYTQPGIGLMQRNNTNGEVVVLHSEPKEDTKSFHVSPSEVSKDKFVILEKQLIPDYLSKMGKKAEEPSALDNFLISMGVKSAPPPPKDTEPMTTYQSTKKGTSYRIPTRLLDEAETQATQQYVRTYRNAWNAMNSGTTAANPSAEGGNIHSAPPRGAANMQDFSPKVDLEKSVRATVIKQFPGLPDAQREQKIKSMLTDIQNLVDQGQITYQDALKRFGGA